VEPVEWGWLFLIGAAVAIALWAGPNLAVAEPAAGAALLLTTAWAVGSLFPRLRRPVRSISSAPYDSLTMLGQAFQEGAMGRQTILATIGTLETEVFGGRRVLLSVEEERHLVGAPPAEFLAWVNARLSALERAS